MWAKREEDCLSYAAAHLDYLTFLAFSSLSFPLPFSLFLLSFSIRPYLACTSSLPSLPLPSLPLPSLSLPSLPCFPSHFPSPYLSIFSPPSIHQGLYIWVGKDAPHELVQKVFGVQHFGAIPEVMVGAPQVQINTGATTESIYSLYTNVWYCIFVLITLVLLWKLANPSMSATCSVCVAMSMLFKCLFACVCCF